MIGSPAIWNDGVVVAESAIIESVEENACLSRDWPVLLAGCST